MPGRNKNKLEDDRPPTPSLPSNGQNELDCRRLTRSSTEKRTNEVSQLEDEPEDPHTPGSVGSDMDYPMGTNDEKPEISDDDSDKASSSSRGGHTPTPASFSKSPSDEPSHIPVPSVPPQDTKNSSDSVPPPSTGQTPSSSQSQWDNFTTALIWIAIAVVVYYVLFSGNKTSKSSSENEDWRLLVDTKEHLSNEHRSMVRASLKPILDKSYTSQDNSISTLLILSSNEEVAAQLGRCLLPMVNSPSNTDQRSAEIDLQKHLGGKLTLDSTLKNLLGSTDSPRAVLLRNIGDTQVEDAFNQLRLLFAYCDGENPVIRQRLFIMTAASDSNTEDGLRQRFKDYWPQEHDFVDALMSRISGHTLYLSEDQKSIC